MGSGRAALERIAKDGGRNGGRSAPPFGRALGAAALRRSLASCATIDAMSSLGRLGTVAMVFGALACQRHERPAASRVSSAASSALDSGVDEARARDARCAALARQAVAAWSSAVSGPCRLDDDCECVDGARPCAGQISAERAAFARQSPAARAIEAERLALRCPDAVAVSAADQSQCAGSDALEPCEATCVEGRCQPRPRCVALRAQYRAALDDRACGASADCVTVLGVANAAIARRALTRVAAIEAALRAERCAGEFGVRRDIDAVCRSGRCATLATVGAL